MEASRPDAVRVEVGANVVEIDLDERDQLLKRLRIIAGFDTVIAKFAATNPRPIELDIVERLRLRVALEIWRNTSELPNGLLCSPRSYELTRAGSRKPLPSEPVD